MKKIYLLLLLTAVTAYADLSVQQIQAMVNKIHEKREGVKLETLQSTKEPFVRLEENNSTSTYVIPTKAKKDARLILHAIVNGKAYINNSWVKIDENILGYKLKFIGNRGVVLRNDNHIKKLFLRKKRDNIIKIEEKK